MRECATERGLPTVRLYFLELALADRASRRARTFFCRTPRAVTGERIPDIVGTNGHKRAAPDAEEIQKILWLRESQGLTNKAIGLRFGRAETTIVRILAARRKLEQS